MIKKVLLYLSLLTIGVLIIAAFVTSTSYTQLIIASLFYPPLAFLIFKNIPINSKAPSSVPTQAPQEMDSDKRAFLKLIGAAGLSYFLYSLFSRKPETLFFNRPTETSMGNLKDSNGNNVNPAERQPTDGYQITEIDESENIYTGFTNNLGAWYIMKADTQKGSFRYTRGDSDFPVNWSNRSNLSYDYFYKVFR